MTNLANNGAPLSLVLQRRPSNSIISPSFGRHLLFFSDANNGFSCAIGKAHTRNLRTEYYANCYVRAEDETRGSHADKAVLGYGTRVGGITFRASKTWQAPVHTYVEIPPLMRGSREDVNSHRSARRIPWMAVGGNCPVLVHTNETMNVPRVVIPILSCVSVGSIKLRSLETALSTS